MSNVRQDLQFAVRQFKKNKTFTLIAILTLALGIGANTAIFSVVYGVLLRPLPFRNPDRLVLVSEKADRFPLLSASYQNFNDWRSQSQSFEAFSAVRPLTMSLTGTGEPAQVPAEMVTGNLLQLLGVKMPLGRGITDTDDKPSSPPVALLGYGLWQRKFNGSKDVLGSTVTLSNQPYTVVGVLPRDYEMLQQVPDVVVAMGPWASKLPDDRSWHPGIFPVARLRDGVTLEQARSEMSTIAKRLLEQYRDTNIAIDAVVNPMQEQLVSNVKPVLLTLFGAVVFVLLIACGNVANLLLTRATARQREISIRSAIGASQWRIVQQLLTEGMALSLVGAFAGLVLAYAATSTLLHTAGSAIPGIQNVHLDLHVLLFTVGVSLLAGVFFGLAPMAHLGLRDLRALLNDADRGSASKQAKGLRGALVVSEVALALLLLVGAGLFLRSFAKLSSVNPGFSVEHILIADIPVSPATYPKPADRMEFFTSVIERLQSLPGVHASGASSFLPVSGGGAILHFNIQGRPPQNPSEYVMANYRAVSAGYRNVLNLPLITGRWVTDADREGSVPVVVINQAMAKLFFPNESPLGKHLQIGATPDPNVPWMEVVGVVGDVKQSLSSDAPTEMYVPFRQANEVLPVYTMSVLLRSEGDPNALAGDLRAAIHQFNANQPIVKVRTMEENVAASIAQPRFRTVLLGIFAVVALAIAAIGIYGVMAYSTSQRYKEMGIRLAMGSSTEKIFQLVLKDGMRLTLIGIVAGAILSFLLGSYLKSLLFAVSTTDALTLVISVLMIVSVGLAASFIPARRAASVHVAKILREN